jgi:hypothetical protein
MLIEQMVPAHVEKYTIGIVNKILRRLKMESRSFPRQAIGLRVLQERFLRQWRIGGILLAQSDEYENRNEKQRNQGDTGQNPNEQTFCYGSWWWFVAVQ